MSKVIVHPEPARSVAEIFDRAAVGPISGTIVVALGLLYISLSIAIAVWSYLHDRGRALRGDRSRGSSMG